MLEADDPFGESDWLRDFVTNGVRPFLRPRRAWVLAELERWGDTPGKEWILPIPTDRELSPISRLVLLVAVHDRARVQEERIVTPGRWPTFDVVRLFANELTEG